MPDLDYNYVVTIAQNATSDPSAVPSNQWQRKVSGNTLWENIAGGTDATYTIAPEDRSAEIRLLQNLNGAKANSNTLTVTSAEPPALASGFISARVLTSGPRFRVKYDSPRAPVKFYYKANESDAWALAFEAPAGLNKYYDDTLSGYYAWESHNLDWMSFSGTNYNCEFVLDEASDFSHCIELNNLFDDCKSFDQDVSWMNTSNCTNFDYMFKNCSAMTGEVAFDTSKAESMIGTFNDLNPSKKVSWNPDLSGWDTSNVTSMVSMFYGMKYFNNSSIVGWDTSQVRDMSYMFNAAEAFNQNISGWCVQKISSEPLNIFLNCPISNAFKPNWGASC